MFNQFLLGENAKLVRNGIYPRTISTKVKYYKYQSQDKQKSMTVMIDTNTAFSPQQLPDYVSNDLVKIRYIEFTEV
jgi:hypothetical protein